MQLQGQKRQQQILESKIRYNLVDIIIATSFYQHHRGFSLSLSVVMKATPIAVR
jgi:hypothetical protein